MAASKYIKTYRGFDIFENEYGVFELIKGGVIMTSLCLVSIKACRNVIDTHYYFSLGADCDNKLPIKLVEHKKRQPY